MIFHVFGSQINFLKKFVSESFRMLLFGKLLYLLVFFFTSSTCVAAEVDCVSLQKNASRYNLHGSIKYYEDKDQDKSLQEVMSDKDISWINIVESTPSFGFTHSAYWLKFDLCKSGNDKEKSVLEIGYPLLDSIHVFAVMDQKKVYEVHTGDMFPFSRRPVQHHNYIFFLPNFPDTASIYLRVKSESSVQVPLNLFTPAQFFEHNQTVLMIQGCYFGIILAMIFYNLFLFFSLKESPYLLYVLFTLSFFCFQSVLQGFFQQFTFDSVWWQSHGLLLFGFISIYFANLFSISFLNLSGKMPAFSKILRTFAYISALAAIFSPALPYAPMVKFMMALTITCSGGVMYAGFKLWWSGHRPARIFTLAWFTLLVSIILASFNKFGLLPRVFWTENIMQIGGVLEVILLSIALGDKINEEKRQRIIGEKNLSSSLEKKVKERTLALNHALQKLEAVNATLDKISLTDALTRIPNRRAFDNHMEKEFKSAMRGKDCLALIMIDIDRFKLFNDTHGHQTGDKVLEQVAKNLQSQATRPRDMVFRYGGEEFAAVLNKTNRAGVITVAEKMRRSIEGLKINIKDKLLTVTISAGIGMYCSKDSDSFVHSVEKLISQADSHLYQAKSNGRNRVSAPKE